MENGTSKKKLQKRKGNRNGDASNSNNAFIIDDVLTRDESEERINLMLIFATLPLTLVLFGFLIKILLVLPIDGKLLTFQQSEGEFKSHRPSPTGQK